MQVISSDEDAYDQNGKPLHPVSYPQFNIVTSIPY